MQQTKVDFHRQNKSEWGKNIVRDIWIEHAHNVMALIQCVSYESPMKEDLKNSGVAQIA